MHACMHARVHVCVYVCMCMRMRMRMCMCMCMCMCVDQSEVVCVCEAMTNMLVSVRRFVRVCGRHPRYLVIMRYQRIGW